jgi:hypothetical protein
MKTTFLLLTCCLAAFKTFGQSCTIDYNQTLVGIYPSALPPAVVGSVFDSDITFVLPTDTLGYPFTNFQIVSINLPLGLSWTCSEAQNNCNYNPQMDVFGCINIHGTPLVSGNFQIDISILADLTVLQGYPYQFQMNLEILPQIIVNSNNAFLYSQSSPCAPALFSFTNNSLGNTLYQWDFGNGSYSIDPNPNPQYYTDSGVYLIDFQAYAQVDTQVQILLNQLTVQSMHNYGENFPSFEEADTYFKVKKNGQIIYQSSVYIDQNPPVSWWPNLNLELGQNYTIEIWEADESIGESYFGPDDYIGNHILNLNSCTGCVAGNANIDYTIEINSIFPQALIHQTDTFTLFEGPSIPDLNYETSSQQLWSSPNPNYLQWYFNGQPIAGQNLTSLNPATDGYYHVMSINNYGCWQSSDTLFIELPNTANIHSENQTVGYQIIFDSSQDQIIGKFESSWLGAQISFYQTDGKLIEQRKIEESELRINGSAFTNGLILVTMLQNNTITQSKIIKSF